MTVWHAVQSGQCAQDAKDTRTRIGYIMIVIQGTVTAEEVLRSDSHDHNSALVNRCTSRSGISASAVPCFRESRIER